MRLIFIKKRGFFESRYFSARILGHHVLLDGNLFPGHESSPSLARGGIDSENAMIRNDGNH
jgi:hypothetical protein